MTKKVYLGKVLYTCTKVMNRESPEGSFLDKINRADLKKVITPTTPFTHLTTEVYLPEAGLWGSGGLGILNGDTAGIVRRLGFSYRLLTLAYAERTSQELDGFHQRINHQAVAPESRLVIRGSSNIGANHDEIDLGVLGSSDYPVVGLYENGLKSAYWGSRDSDHRLYQMAVLGFGGYQVLHREGVEPSFIRLDEASSSLFALARLDGYIKNIQARGIEITPVIFNFILKGARKSVGYTNHTLVPASVSTFDQRQVESYIFPNLQSDLIKDWLIDMMNQTGRLDTSVLTSTLAGKYNGVSQMHAAIASGRFYRVDGTPVNFSAITNGVDMQRWTYKDLYDLYRDGIIDCYELPEVGFAGKIENLPVERLYQIKQEAKQELLDFLKGRANQYEQAIDIPGNATVVCWGKRMADYKRPELLLEDNDRLKQILVEQNMHVLITGKAHEEDHKMRGLLHDILTRINQDEVLKQRMHFVVDYDTALAEKLVAGVDIWLNVPEVGREACGTSIWKALANLSTIVATEDGGIADIKPAVYLQVQGDNRYEEVKSMYQQLENAGRITRNIQSWGSQVKSQLSAYLPIIAGGRMMQDYLNFAFPRKALAPDSYAY